jgi:hypothetical protein
VQKKETTIGFRIIIESVFLSAAIFSAIEFIYPVGYIRVYLSVPSKYDRSLHCFEEALGIAKENLIVKRRANILTWNIGRSYQDWEKYEGGDLVIINKGRELYQQLGKSNVANQLELDGRLLSPVEEIYEQAIAHHCQQSREFSSSWARKNVADSQVLDGEVCTIGSGEIQTGTRCREQQVSSASATRRSTGI